MPQHRVLIACIGNIFLGDDAFGVEIARQLAQRQLPDLVKVVDFGIRGLDLAYALLEGYEAVILVDAVSRGERPGTVSLIELDLSALDRQSGEEAMVEAHSMHPEKVLRVAASMGAKFGKISLVGCEPVPFDPEIDMRMELSEPVSAALGAAIELIESQVAEILNGLPVGVAS
jgi:hydrogenase maturation protease